MARMNAEALFDDVGPAYESAFASQLQNDSIVWVLDKVRDRVPAKILDIGSGTGRPVCKSFADAGHDVLGIDISSVMVEHARKAVPNARFKHRDILHYDPQDSYDAITIYFSVIADFTQDQIRGICQKIYNWLNPGGVFVFATVTLDGNLIETEWLGRHVTISSLSSEQALVAVKHAGFSIVKHDQCEFTPKAEEAGLCKKEQIWPEPHFYVYATKDK